MYNKETYKDFINVVKSIRGSDSENLEPCSRFLSVDDFDNKIRIRVVMELDFIKESCCSTDYRNIPVIVEFNFYNAPGNDNVYVKVFDISSAKEGFKFSEKYLSRLSDLTIRTFPLVFKQYSTLTFNTFKNKLSVYINNNSLEFTFLEPNEFKERFESGTRGITEEDKKEFKAFSDILLGKVDEEKDNDENDYDLEFDELCKDEEMDDTLISYIDNEIRGLKNEMMNLVLKEKPKYNDDVILAMQADAQNLKSQSAYLMNKIENHQRDENSKYQQMEIIIQNLKSQIEYLVSRYHELSNAITKFSDLCNEQTTSIENLVKENFEYQKEIEKLNVEKNLKKSYNEEKEKERKMKFDNTIMKNFMPKKLDAGSVAFTMNGNIAVKRGDTYVAYNADSNTIEDTMGLVFGADTAHNLCLLMPTATNALRKNDIVCTSADKATKHFKVVTGVKDGAVSYINLNTGDTGTFTKETNTIIGQDNTYLKLVSFINGNNGTFNPMMLMLLSEDGGDKGNVEKLLPLMLMTQAQQGNNAMAFNPLMLMALVGDKGLSDDKAMLLAMSGAFGNGGMFGNVQNNCTCDCDCEQAK